MSISDFQECNANELGLGCWTTSSSTGIAVGGPCPVLLENPELGSQPWVSSSSYLTAPGIQSPASLTGFFSVLKVSSSGRPCGGQKCGISVTAHNP